MKLALVRVELDMKGERYPRTSNRYVFKVYGECCMPPSGEVCNKYEVFTFPAPSGQSEYDKRKPERSSIKQVVC